MNFKLFNRSGRSAELTAQPASGNTPVPVIATRSQAAITAEAIELPTRRSATSAPGQPAASTRRFGKQQTLDRLARILDRGKNAAFVAGVGRYETTTAITPFRSTVNSAAPKLKSTVRGEGMPEWTLPKGVANAPARRPKGPSPEDILYRKAAAPAAAVPGSIGGASETLDAVSRIVDRHFPLQAGALLKLQLPRRELTAAICAAGAQAALTRPEIEQLAESLATRHAHATDAKAALTVVLDRNRIFGDLESNQAVSRRVDQQLRSSPADHREALKTAINEIAGIDSPALTPAQRALVLTPAERTLLAKRVTRCFDSAAQATRALRSLGDVRLLGEIGQPRSTNADQKLAWKLAASLESLDGIGLDLLDKLTDRAPAGSTQVQSRAPLGVDDRFSVRAYMRAASEIARAAGPAAGLALDPGSLYAHGNVAAAITEVRRRSGNPQAWPGRGKGVATPPNVRLEPTEKALLALHDKLDPDVHVPHGCDFAIGMMCAGMLTDRPAQPGAPKTKSEFFLTNSRIDKAFGLHVDRALGLKGLPAAKEAVTRPLLHHGKSPYFAIDTVVARGAGVKFSLAHHSAIGEGRMLAEDMMGSIVDALARSGGPAGSPLPTPTSQRAAADIAAETEPTTLQGLLRTALMKRMRADQLFLPRLPMAPEIPPHVMDEAKADVLSAVASYPADPVGAKAVQDTLAHLAADHAGTRLTPQTLRDWAADAGAPWSRGGDVGSAMARAAQQPTGDSAADWSAFAKAYPFVAEGARPEVEIRPVKGAQREEFAATLEDMLNGLELIGGFSASNAGNTNGSTKAVSEIVSGILSGGAAALRLDVGGDLIREVSFEAGTATDRMAMRMSVATLRRVHGCAGGSAGLHLGETSIAGASLAVGADAGYSYELVRQEGATIGFARHLSGGVNGDKVLYKKLGEMGRKLVLDTLGDDRGLDRPGNPEDQQPLKRLFATYPDVLAGRFTVEESNHRTTLAALGGANVTFGHFKLGLTPANVSRQWRKGTMVYEDQSGAMKVRKVMHPDTSKVTLGGSLATMNGLIDTLEPTKVAGRTLADTTQLAAGALVNVSMDVQHRGMSDTSIDIAYLGKTLPTAFWTRTFERMKEANADLGQNRQQYGAEQAEKYFPANHAADPERTVAAQVHSHEQFLARNNAERDRTTQTQKYEEYKSEQVRRLDILKANAQQAAADGEAGTAGESLDAQQGILDDPDCRQHRFAIAIHNQSNKVVNGPSNLLGFGSTMRYGLNQHAGEFD